MKICSDVRHVVGYCLTLLLRCTAAVAAAAGCANLDAC